MAWVTVGNIRGPQGPQGMQGPKGDPGDAGDFDASDVINALGFTPADVAALADIATSGSASDLITGTVPDGVLRDGLRGQVTYLSTAGQLNDTVRLSGWYGIDDSISPFGVSGILLHFRASSSSGQGQPPTSQLLYNADRTTYHRVLRGSEWTDWERFTYSEYAYWVTEDDDRIVTEDGDNIILLTSIR